MSKGKVISERAAELYGIAVMKMHKSFTDEEVVSAFTAAITAGYDSDFVYFSRGTRYMYLAQQTTAGILGRSELKQKYLNLAIEDFNLIINRNTEHTLRKNTMISTLENRIKCYDMAITDSKSEVEKAKFNRLKAQDNEKIAIINSKTPTQNVNNQGMVLNYLLPKSKQKGTANAQAPSNLGNNTSTALNNQAPIPNNARNGKVGNPNSPVTTPPTTKPTPSIITAPAPANIEANDYSRQLELYRDSLKLNPYDLSTVNAVVELIILNEPNIRGYKEAAGIIIEAAKAGVPVNLSPKYLDNIRTIAGSLENISPSTLEGLECNKLAIEIHKTMVGNYPTFNASYLNALEKIINGVEIKPININNNSLQSIAQEVKRILLLREILENERINPLINAKFRPVLNNKTLEIVELLESGQNNLLTQIVKKAKDLTLYSDEEYANKYILLNLAKAINNRMDPIDEITEFSTDWDNKPRTDLKITIQALVRNAVILAKNEPDKTKFKIARDIDPDAITVDEDLETAIYHSLKNEDGGLVMSSFDFKNSDDLAKRLAGCIKQEKFAGMRTTTIGVRHDVLDKGYAKKWPAKLSSRVASLGRAVVNLGNQKISDEFDLRTATLLQGCKLATQLNMEEGVPTIVEQQREEIYADELTMSQAGRGYGIPVADAMVIPKPSAPPLQTQTLQPTVAALAYSPSNVGSMKIIPKAPTTPPPPRPVAAASSSLPAPSAPPLQPPSYRERVTGQKEPQTVDVQHNANSLCNANNMKVGDPRWVREVIVRTNYPVPTRPVSPAKTPTTKVGVGATTPTILQKPPAPPPPPLPSPRELAAARLKAGSNGAKANCL